MADLGVDAETVEALVQQGRLEVDARRRLVAIHGLSARPTLHRIEHEEGVVHTWCAYDAVGIPAALGLDGRAVTACPTCGEYLVVGLAGGTPTGAGQLRLWFPDNGCAHLVEDFCRHANLYCGADHLEAAAPASPGRMITVAEAADLGRTTWSDVATYLSA